MALEELPRIIHIGRGFLDRFEINTVLSGPSRVTVNTTVGVPKRANTYIVLLRPVVTQINAPGLSLKVYPHENFYLPSTEGFLIFEPKGEANPKKGKFIDLSFEEISPGVNLGESRNLLFNARRVEKSFRLEKTILTGAHRIMVRAEKDDLESPIILFLKSSLKALMGSTMKTERITSHELFPYDFRFSLVVNRSCLCSQIEVSLEENQAPIIVMV